MLLADRSLTRGRMSGATRRGSRSESTPEKRCGRRSPLQGSSMRGASGCRHPISHLTTPSGVQALWDGRAVQGAVRRASCGVEQAPPPRAYCTAEGACSRWYLQSIGGRLEGNVLSDYGRPKLPHRSIFCISRLNADRRTKCCLPVPSVSIPASHRREHESGWRAIYGGTQQAVSRELFFRRRPNKTVQPSATYSSNDAHENISTIGYEVGVYLYKLLTIECSQESLPRWGQGGSE